MADKSTFPIVKKCNKAGAKSRCKITPEVLEKIGKWAGEGLTQVQIHNALGWSHQTWYRRVKSNPEIATLFWKSKSYCISKVWGALYRSALQGNTAAQIFWLKINAGARENQVIDINHSNADLKPLVINSKDPVEASKLYQQIMLGDKK